MKWNVVWFKGSIDILSWHEKDARGFTMEFIIIYIRTNFQNIFTIRFAISFFSHFFFNFEIILTCRKIARLMQRTFRSWAIEECYQQYALWPMQILYCVYFSRTTFSYISTHNDRTRTWTMMLYYNPIHRPHSIVPTMSLQRTQPRVTPCFWLSSLSGFLQPRIFPQSFLDLPDHFWW